MPPPLRPLRALPESAIVRGSVALLVAALVSVLWATPALAHPALIETVPGAGYAVTTPPEAVRVSFNEPVTPVGDALTLHRADGMQVRLDVSLSPDGTSLRGVLQQELTAASYEVTYDVVALDGDLITGAFPFGVATPVEADSTAGGSSQDDPDQLQAGTAVPRALLFLGLALALGGDRRRVDRAPFDGPRVTCAAAGRRRGAART